MISKKEIKLITSLTRKKERKNKNLFVVEGVKNVSELLKSEFKVEMLYELNGQTQFKESIEISEIDMKRISHLSSPSPALAIARIPDNGNPDINKTSIILEDIKDPGNLGTIIRTADWFGIDQIICSINSVDCWNSKVVASTMGSIFRTKIFYRDIVEFISASPLPSYCALMEGKPLFDIKIKSDANLVFGSESHGTSEHVKQVIDHQFTITGNSKAESLNLSIATGITISHFFNNK